MTRLRDLFRARPSSAAGQGHPAVQAACTELRMFVQACLVQVDPAESLNARAQRLLALFFLGAAARMAIYHGFARDYYALLGLEALRQLDVPGTDTERLLAESLALPESAPENSVMKEGGDTMESWRSGRDNNAALRLAQLLKEWQ